MFLGFVINGKKKTETTLASKARNQFISPSSVTTAGRHKGGRKKLFQLRKWEALQNYTGNGTNLCQLVFCRLPLLRIRINCWTQQFRQLLMIHILLNLSLYQFTN